MWISTAVANTNEDLGNVDIFQYKISTASNWTTAATFESSYDTHKYIYTGLEQRATYNVRVIISDRAGNKKTSNICTDDTKEIKISDIGKYVSYNPINQTYDKSILDIYSGTTSNKSFTTENLKWKIWNIDSQNIYLVASTPTSNKLKLKVALAYNNGVTLLNEICETCYSADYKGITVRNMNLEDLASFYTLTKDGRSDSATFAPPYYWSAYGTDPTNEKNIRSNNLPLTNKDTASESLITVTSTSQYNRSISDTRFSEILHGDSTNQSWLSTRCVYNQTTKCWRWCINTIGPTSISYTYLYLLQNGAAQSSEITTYGLRPFVIIPRSSVTSSLNVIN